MLLPAAVVLDSLARHVARCRGLNAAQLAQHHDRGMCEQCRAGRPLLSSKLPASALADLLPALVAAGRDNT